MIRWKKKKNQLDFGDFRQFILYFRFSIWTYIEYRIKISTMTYPFFAFLDYQYHVYLFAKENDQLSTKQFFQKL